MKKRILSLFIAAIMILSLIPVIAIPASADDPTAIAIIDGSFVGYKGWLKANDGQDRYTQRGNTFGVRSGYEVTKAYDGNNTTYANTYGVDNYYPMAYLNGSGELVVDSTYNNVDVDVDISEYLASGLGKYYGIYTFTLTAEAALDTITVYSGMNGDGSVDAKKAFDVLYSADGTHWTLAGSYTGMETASNWTSSTSSLATLNVNGNGDDASYVAVAFSGKDGQMKGNLWLFEVAVTGVLKGEPAPEPTPQVYEVGTAEELIAALTTHNTYQFTEDVIKLTADIVLPDNWAGRYVYGTFDGQGHTIYNLKGSFIWPIGNSVFQNFKISGKTAPDGEYFSVSAKGTSVFGGNATADEIKADETAIIRNVTNERDLIGTDNYNGGFFGALTIAGTVKFENCVANNKSLQAPEDKLDESSTYFGNNHKIGNFVGCMNSGTLICENCVNNGKVAGSQVGGFVGKYSGGCTIKLTDCTNTGTIIGMNGSGAYGIAGGFIGSMNNAQTDDGNTIKLIRCVNTGDILVANQGSKTNAIGGLIGHAGGGSGEQTRITITNCAVYGCTINTNGASEYAAPLVGKCSPKDSETFKITANSCYVSDVNVIGGMARKLIGVGTHNEDIEAVIAYNCVLNNVTEDGSAEWNSSKFTGVSVKAKATADNGAIDTDYYDLISKGTAGFAQKSTAGDKVRFIATISEDTFASGNIVKVGFLVTAKTAEGDEYGWNLSGTTLYTSLKANGMETWTPDNGDAYIFAATITDIPADTNGEFYATPYLVAADGSMIFGSTGTLVLGSGL